MPMTFTIDDTDFKIDETKSRYSLKVQKSGDAVIEAEIYGEQEQYEKITQDYDSSPWSDVVSAALLHAFLSGKEAW